MAYVIVNRARIARAYRDRTGDNHALFGDGTLAGACLAPGQFSVWMKSDPNHRLLAKASKMPGWEECVDAVMTAVSGREKDPTANSTHYCNKHARPAWARRETPTTIVGNHKFYRLSE